MKMFLNYLTPFWPKSILKLFDHANPVPVLDSEYV